MDFTRNPNKYVTEDNKYTFIEAELCDSSENSLFLYENVAGVQNVSRAFAVNAGSYILKLNNAATHEITETTDWKVSFIPSTITPATTMLETTTTTGNTLSGFGVLGYENWIKFNVVTGGKQARKNTKKKSDKRKNL